MKRFLLLLVPLLLLAGCDQTKTEPAKPTVDLAKEAADIRTTDDNWKAAVKARDAAKIASFWADDATLIVPGAPPVTGRANLQKFVEDTFKDKDFNITWVADKIEVAASGDMAYETAINTITAHAGKKLVTTKNFGTVVWKKQSDGSWKAVVDQSTELPATDAKAMKK